jgi:hypothetical protein
MIFAYPLKMVNDKLEALRKKEAALKTAIAEEKVRQLRKKQRDDARLFSVMGETLTKHAAQSPDFRLMLKQVLQAAELREADRSFLAGKGWL